jgi:hypothetical protein
LNGLLANAFDLSEIGRFAKYRLGVVASRATMLAKGLDALGERLADSGELSDFKPSSGVRVDSSLEAAPGVVGRGYCGRRVDFVKGRPEERGQKQERSQAKGSSAASQ